MYQIILNTDKQKPITFLQKSAIANWQVPEKCNDCLTIGQDNVCSHNMRNGDGMIPGVTSCMVSPEKQGLQNLVRDSEKLGYISATDAAMIQAMITR